MLFMKFEGLSLSIGFSGAAFMTNANGEGQLPKKADMINQDKCCGFESNG